MKNTTGFLFKNYMIGIPVIFVLLIWISFWAENRLDANFNSWGIYPRTLEGLKGILFSPFIHGDASHLWHNTLPLFILSTTVFYFYEAIAYKIFCIGFIATGVLTWCIGRASFHIGASGIIYMLFGFLLLKGLLTKHFRLLAVSFFVVFVYGGMIWYVAPIDYKISWEGHLSGLLTGFAMAVSQNKPIHKIPKYDWEFPNYDSSNDPFMQCFDEQGNFIPTPKKEEPVINLYDEVSQTVTFETDKGIQLIYHTVPNKEEDI